MRFSSSALTNVGRHREKNEDNYLNIPGLWAVADGMGGHVGGEVASRMAINGLRQAVTHAMVTSEDDASGFGAIFSRIHEAILAESRRIHALWGMGTTMTALRACEDGRAWIGHVGDSACVLVRDGRVMQCTREHSAWGLGYAKEKNRQTIALLNCLGGGPDMKMSVDVLEIQLRPRDVLVLATDGLTDYASADKIGDIVEVARKGYPEHLPASVATKLVNYALDEGGHDNVTVVVLEVKR